MIAIPWIAIPCGPPSSWCLNPRHRWEKDPCCNWVKRQEQCCGPRSVEAGWPFWPDSCRLENHHFFHRLINTLVNHMVNIILLVVVNLAMENHYVS